jgi:hypothetical protein
VALKLSIPSKGWDPLSKVRNLVVYLETRWQVVERVAIDCVRGQR